MEFIIKQSVLKEELGFVQGIVEKKNTIPVLSNILIESLGENTIRILGTDLDVTIRCDAEAEIIKPGAICVQARKLFDIVRLLPDADVRFTKVENEWVKVQCQRSNFRLAGVSRDQFPEVPNFKSAPLRLPAKFFQYFIQYTAFAITQEQSRYTLSGAKFMVDSNSARMVTTDGHRLALVERKDLGSYAPSEPLDTLIPKKALAELTKLSRDSNADIAFGEDINHIYFEIGPRLLISRKLSGQFPNYEMVIPKSNDKTAIFDCEEMRNAIRRVSVMADERTRSVKLELKTGEIQVSSSSSEEGEAVEVIPVEYEGEEVTVGYNSQYLMDFLNVALGAGSGDVKETAEGEEPEQPTPPAQTGTRIIFEFRDGNAQSLLRPAADSGYDYKYVVMPMRV
jgi:DNA polymerase-3 subunit beta